MRGIKASLVLASVAVVGLALWAGAVVDHTGSRMAVAADRFLASLSGEQASKARYDFDSEERLNWHFIPRERKGLPIKELNSEQRALAFGLIQSGLAGSGFLKATSIMSLEAILRDMEQGRGPTRDPELYFLTIFGKPSDRGKWGWRVEGHHLSLNFVLEDGKIAASTPAFFGANPAEIRQGPRSGLRTLAEREDRALRLLQAFDEEHRKKALFAAEAPADVRAAHTVQPPTDPAVGVAYADMNRDQQAMLRALVESYAEDMPEEISPRLAERGEATPALTRSGSPGPAPPTAAVDTPTASRARRSLLSSTTPRTARTIFTPSGGTCSAISASQSPRTADHS